MERETLSALEYIRQMYPKRHENHYLRIILWNAIGAERRLRIRQARRYPYNRRFITRQD
jgi:hypothetical protein